MALFAQTDWPRSLAARPTPPQLAWQEREVELFLHFGINTFVGVEWGSGKASPQLFNPTNLDCRQWVAVVRSGGARGAVLTVKQHDGFCLWPTDTTDYSVRTSPWQAGKGDVVLEFMAACREAGLAAGLYEGVNGVRSVTSILDGSRAACAESPLVRSLYGRAADTPIREGMRRLPRRTSALFPAPVIGLPSPISASPR